MAIFPATNFRCLDDRTYFVSATKVLPSFFLGRRWLTLQPWCSITSLQCRLLCRGTLDPSCDP